MHKNEKWLILGIIVCLLVFIVGYSFAYFTSGVVTSGSGSSTNAKTAELITTKYDAGTSKLELTNAVPGDKKSKSFTVTVTPTNDDKTATYAISLKIDTNTFSKCTSQTDTNQCTLNAEELTYTLKDNSGNTLKTGDITGTTGTIELLKETKTPSSETIYNYTLEIEFKNTDADQNHNANKSFTGSIEVAYA